MPDVPAVPPEPARHRPLAPLRRYLVAIILLATLPLATLACWQILADVRADQRQIEAGLERSAAALSQAVDSELLASFDALATLSRAEALREGRAADLQMLLRSHPPPRRDWTRIFLLDAQGQLMADTAAEGGSPALSDLYQQVRLHAQPVVARSPVPGDAASGGSVLLAVPLLQNGQLRFVLGAAIQDAAWQRLVAAASRPEGGNALVYDAQQRLVARAPAAGRAGGAASPPAQAQLLHPSSPGVQRTSGADGQAVYAAWQPVATGHWAVQVEVPARPIDEAHRQAVLGALAASGGSLLLGVLLAAIAARRVTRPLHRLATEGHAVPGRIPVLEIAMLRNALRAAADSDAQARRRLEDDIAQRKRVERDLLAAHEALQGQQRLIDLAQEAGEVGFFDYRFEGDTLAWTPGHCRLFGIERLPPGGLQQWFGRIAEADRARVQADFAAACAARRDTTTVDYAAPRPDGRTRWLSTRLLLRYRPDGTSAQATGVTVDMTDQREAELQRARLTEQALAARHEAEAASRAKDEFLSMLGHELRNPLGAISAAVDVLDTAAAKGEDSPEARAIIARQARNLSHMMNDLLDVGRLVAGKVLLAREPVNLALLADRVRATLALTHEADAHELLLQLEDAWVDGDAVRLEQVMTNLVTNAIKYTPAGRAVIVTVGVRGADAVFEVQDAGLGIPATLLPHVFDLFVQGERTLDRRPGGLGIGLTLARRLVELHGGSIAVSSSAAGSCFTVRLPAVAPPACMPEDALPPSRRRRVLVVEDNPDVLAALRSKLELDGHSVTTAVDGVEGLSRLLRQQPEVSIVDIGLPGMTGYELARHARAAGYTGRMVAVSGYGQERDADAAMVAGFDAYLVKPVERGQLRASLDSD